MKREIAADLLKIKAVFLRPDAPFTWASGIKAPIYCDNRLTLSDIAVRTDVENALAELIRRHYPDCQAVMGTSTAGIAHAAIVATILGLPMGYVRAAAKDHGRTNQIDDPVLAPAGFPLHHAHQFLHRQAAHLVHVLPHGRDGQRGVGRDADVVVPDHLHLVRHPQMRVLQRLQGAHGQPVRLAEDAVKGNAGPQGKGYRVIGVPLVHLADGQDPVILHDVRPVSSACGSPFSG